MQQTPTLSDSDRIVLEASLRRMVGDAFGALATLPLYCLGDLSSSDPAAIVVGHYDVWHSCLVVARETLRADAAGPEVMLRPLEDLLSLAAELRDAYLTIQRDLGTNGDSTLQAYRQLVSAYNRLPVLIKEVADEWGVDSSFLPGPQSLKRATGERTLNWLGEELRGRAAHS